MGFLCIWTFVFLLMLEIFYLSYKNYSLCVLTYNYVMPVICRFYSSIFIVYFIIYVGGVTNTQDHFDFLFVIEMILDGTSPE